MGNKLNFCLWQNLWSEVAFSNTFFMRNFDCARCWRYFCLWHISWSQVAFPNATQIETHEIEIEHCIGAILTSDTSSRRGVVFSNLHWATCWLRITTQRWSYFRLRHMTWSEIAFPNAPPIGNVTPGFSNTVLELLSSRTHFVTRDSILQHTPQENNGSWMRR